jgi:ribosomal-protein-alanine N-acetyltransferase
MEDEGFKRKGLMTEVLEVIIDYRFNRMNLNRIESLMGTENIPSLRLIDKDNFIKEGLLRQHYYSSGKYEDSILFSKLYIEYINEK